MVQMIDDEKTDDVPTDNETNTLPTWTVGHPPWEDIPHHDVITHCLTTRQAAQKWDFATPRALDYRELFLLAEQTAIARMFFTRFLADNITNAKVNDQRLRWKCSLLLQV